MAGIDDWLELMPAQVIVAPFVSYDAYSNPSYGAPVTYQARVTYRTRRIMTASGEEVVSRGEAWLATVAPMTTKDKVTLPDGSNPLVLTMDQVPDENGPLYTHLNFA